MVQHSFLWYKLQDMHFLGQTQHGVYYEHNNEDYNLICELGDKATDVVDVIASCQQENVNHKAVHAPTCWNPFRSDEETIFFTGLCEVIAQDITLDNFGLTPEEWDLEHYPIFEMICVGHRAAKDIDVLLADPIWYTQAHLWCQALSALTFYLFDWWVYLIWIKCTMSDHWPHCSIHQSPALMSSSGVCRGGNGDCDCKHFRPKPNEPSHCWECAHGISKHPNTDDMIWWPKLPSPNQLLYWDRQMLQRSSGI